MGRLESIVALYHSLRPRDTLSEEDSQAAIEDSIVTLGKFAFAQNDEHVSAEPIEQGTGLLLTTDGWILTAGHVTASWGCKGADPWRSTEVSLHIPDQGEVVLYGDETLSLVRSSYMRDSPHDLALVKADIGEIPRAIAYNVSSAGPVDGEHVRVRGMRWESPVLGRYESEGVVVATDVPLHAQMAGLLFPYAMIGVTMVRAPAKPGVSGGSMSRQGSFVGTVTVAESEKECYVGSGCIPVQYARALVQRAAISLLANEARGNPSLADRIYGNPGREIFAAGNH